MNEVLTVHHIILHLKHDSIDMATQLYQYAICLIFDRQLRLYSPLKLLHCMVGDSIITVFTVR